jgi:hypothetical protein
MLRSLKSPTMISSRLQVLSLLLLFTGLPSIVHGRVGTAEVEAGFPLPAYGRDAYGLLHQPDVIVGRTRTLSVSSRQLYGSQWSWTNLFCKSVNTAATSSTPSHLTFDSMQSTLDSVMLLTVTRAMGTLSCTLIAWQKTHQNVQTYCRPCGCPDCSKNHPVGWQHGYCDSYDSSYTSDGSSSGSSSSGSSGSGSSSSGSDGSTSDAKTLYDGTSGNTGNGPNATRKSYLWMYLTGAALVLAAAGIAIAMRKRVSVMRLHCSSQTGSRCISYYRNLTRRRTEWQRKALWLRVVR